MNRAQAIQLAIKALVAARRRVTPEAMMNKLYGIRGAEHVKARAEFERINAAIEILEQEVKEK